MLFIKPSPIEGIGVFTSADIKAGAVLKMWTEDDLRFIPEAEAARDPEFAFFGERYCVRVPGGYHCPLSFQRMSIGWFTNHSEAPNARCEERLNWNYVAIRDIRAGEEILIDYSQLSAEEAALSEAFRLRSAASA
jgi:SET domain-containing protein